jgi:hypothetical protein
LKILILALFFLTVATQSIAADKRYTAGWMRQWHEGWKSNLLLNTFKVPEKHSIFKLSVGMSEAHNKTYQLVEGDLEAELLGILSLELPQEYSLSKATKEKLFITQLGYEYYYPVWKGDWWRIKFEYYISAGIMGHLQFRTSLSKYKYRIVVEENQEFSDTIKLPNGIIGSSFSFGVPVCNYFDMGISTVNACGAINMDQPKHSFASVSLSFGF